MKRPILSLVIFAAALTSWSPAADTQLPQAARPAGPGCEFVYLGDNRPVLYRLHIEVDGKPLQAAWDEFIGHVFQYADTDGDGVLTKDEAERIPVPGALFSGGGGNAPAMNTLDADQDGKVSRDELANYYRRNGGPPFTLYSGRNQTGMYQVVTLNDGRSQTPSADALNDTMFKLLDANNDGKLSREELAAAPVALLKRDGNDDELVASQEVVPNAGAADDYALAVQLAYLDRSASDGNPSFVAVAPGESATRLAQQLQSKYTPKGAKRGSRDLSRADIGLDEASFNQLDADSNGELDKEELARFTSRQADVELIVRLGKTAAGKPAVEVVSADGKPGPLGANLRVSKEGGMVLDLGNARLDLRSGGDRPEMRFGVNNRMIYKAQFTAADRDNNSYLDKMEAQQSQLFRGLFRAMDRDNDGMVYEKEMLAYFDQIEDLQTKAKAGCCALNISDQGKGLFDLIDANRDGRLSVRELRNAARLVDDMDRDGDRQLGRGEIPRSYQLALNPGGVGSGQTYGRVVVATRSAGFGNEPAPPPGAGPVWFRKMDRNRDGDVSRREFLGTEEEFKRIDTDSDGLLSMEEAERYDTEVRKQKR